MSAGDACRCATCSDAADAGVVRALDERDAEVEMEGGGVRVVAVDLIEGVAVGDVVLVHQGVAIARAARAEVVS